LLGGALVGQRLDDQVHELVLERLQVLQSPSPDLLADQLGDAVHEQSRSELGEGRELRLLDPRSFRECVEHRREALMGPVALLERAAAGRLQVDHVCDGELRAVLPPVQVDPKTVAQRNGPGFLAYLRVERLEHLRARLVARGEKAILLVGEQLVEGVARHARPGHHVGDRRSGVPALGDLLLDGLEESRALGVADEAA
jgi:hypothetical protein